MTVTDFYRTQADLVIDATILVLNLIVWGSVIVAFGVIFYKTWRLTKTKEKL